MSLAISHNEFVSALPSSTGNAKRKTVEFALVVAFVVLALASILFTATQATTPETEQAMTAVTQF